ncbi:putative transcription factor bZIP family [Helianthus debilis subsp. tardiflorus]
MANSRGPSAARNMTCSARNSLLPPKCPFPSIPPSYGDHISNSVNGPKRIPKYRDGNHWHHHRTSSESLVIEEQPSWLDELLNEPETPVQRGHRRSSSDSFTYLEAANAVNTEYAVRNEQEMKSLSLNPPWGAQDFVYKDARNMSYYGDGNVGMRSRTRGWDSPKDVNLGLQRSVSLGATQKLDGIGLTGTERLDAAELGTQDSGEARPQDANGSSERKDCLNNKNSASETDTKRAKQQFAQRSRVRKLQYIAELERNVHALQSEGFEVSAQLEFLNQQSLILGMENKALKQRLENLAQEQLIKRLEHEVLEREIGRLRALYKQQQQPQQQPPQSHRRTASHDRLDFQFANLTLKNKDSSSVLDPVSSQPRT